MWYQIIGNVYFRFVTKQACVRRTDRHADGHNCDIQKGNKHVLHESRYAIFSVIQTERFTCAQWGTESHQRSGGASAGIGVTKHDAICDDRLGKM